MRTVLARWCSATVFICLCSVACEYSAFYRNEWWVSTEKPVVTGYVMMWQKWGSFSEGVVFCRERLQPSEGPQAWVCIIPLLTHCLHSCRHHQLNYVLCVVEHLEARIVSSTWHDTCALIQERNLMLVHFALTGQLRKLIWKAMLSPVMVETSGMNLLKGVMTRLLVVGLINTLVSKMAAMLPEISKMLEDPRGQDVKLYLLPLLQLVDWDLQGN